ncbi:hypothetical protein SSIN_1724 [Streptococcus sinensis]|uniref:Uncharacterized protein n=1 Tax=Streptococcus sinensis TaxID=176090 RepID=A0A0A0DCU6_9STRE|nr:hypothetical protein SSIN_1724 [Streptococcus sinensis]
MIANGLLRECFPKKTDLATITEKSLNDTYWLLTIVPENA